MKNQKALKTSKRYTAFTLAEVLLTLTIIGVVASMTIPSLLSQTSNEQYKAKFKKIFANYQQAITLEIMNRGGSLQGMCADYDSSCFRDHMENHFNYIKSDMKNNLDWSFTYKDGSTTDPDGKGLWVSNDWPALVLNDGTIITFRYHACDGTTFDPADCGWSWVDVNGTKKPNKIGTDIFIINVEKNRLKLHEYNASYCTGQGFSCEEKILIGEDY